MTLFLLVVFALVANLCTGTNLPSTFTKCNRKQTDFNDCLKGAIEDAIRQLSTPMPEVGLPSMQPLLIPEISIGAGVGGAVNFAQNYKDLKLGGFENVKCTTAEANLEAKSLTLDCSSPEVTMDFRYEIDGQLLVLPIKGDGPGHISIKDLNLLLNFALEPYDKKGKKHFKVTGTTLKLTPKLISFKLDNLFNGDKVLGDSINQVMNDNWQELFVDIEPNYEEAFGQTFASIFNNLLRKVSVSELFGDE